MYRRIGKTNKQTNKTLNKRLSLYVWPVPCGSRTGVGLQNARASPKDPPSLRGQFCWGVFLCPYRSILCPPFLCLRRLPSTNCPLNSLIGGRKRRGIHSWHCLSAGVRVAGTVCVHVWQAAPFPQLSPSQWAFPGPLWPARPPVSPLLARPQLWDSPFTRFSFIIPRRVPSVPEKTLTKIERLVFEEYLIMLICLQPPWPCILLDQSPDLQGLDLGTQGISGFSGRVNGPDKCHLTTLLGQLSESWTKKSQTIQGIFGTRWKTLFGNVFWLSDVSLMIRKAKSKRRQGRQPRFIAVYLVFITPCLKRYFILRI